MELNGIRQAGTHIVETVKAICRMCHGGCGTIITLKDGIVEKVVGDPDNPVNDGLLCSKGGVRLSSNSTILTGSIIR
jgi:anaerobic selenocysteine-containing dehydrogenase